MVAESKRTCIPMAAFFSPCNVPWLCCCCGVIWGPPIGGGPPICPPPICGPPICGPPICCPPMTPPPRFGYEKLVLPLGLVPPIGLRSLVGPALPCCMGGGLGLRSRRELRTGIGGLPPPSARLLYSEDGPLFSTLVLIGCPPEVVVVVVVVVVVTVWLLLLLLSLSAWLSSLPVRLGGTWLEGAVTDGSLPPYPESVFEFLWVSGSLAVVLVASGLSLEWRREENLNFDFFSEFVGADMVKLRTIEGDGGA